MEGRGTQILVDSSLRWVDYVLPAILVSCPLSLSLADLDLLSPRCARPTSRESIRESARKEYEAARFEKDPQIINKLIVSGRDCLEKSLQNVIDKQRQIVEDQMKSGPPDNGI